MQDLRHEFFFEGNQIGALVIHGFTSAPAEVYELGCHLRDAGMTVLGVRLAGHGTDVEDFGRSTELDWIESARSGYARLRKKCKTVYVLGHSMGGLLALYLAENEPVDKLVLLAPALVYRHWYVGLAGIIRHFLREYSWEVSAFPPEQQPYMLHYPRFPMSAVHRMTKLQRLVRGNLGAVKTDTLLILARKDEQVHNRTERVLAQAYQVRQTPLRCVWFERSTHSLTAGSEKARVFATCLSFLQREGEGLAAR